MKIQIISSLISLALAYRPGGLDPNVLSFVNFGQNPFTLDQTGSNPNAFSQLPGYTGGDLLGNVFTSASNDLALYVSNQKFDVPGLGSEIELSGRMAFQASVDSGYILSPAGINKDPLYGAGQFGALDLDQGWIFSMILTNQRIYALYGRLPVARTLVNDYYSFSYLVPIAQRSDYSSNDLSVVLNKSHFTVSYRVEGVERLFIERVGGPMDAKFLFSDDGGLIQCMGFPDKFQLLFGTGLLVNAGNPYTACQTCNVFDQCVETYLEADRIVCDYYPVQDPNTYVIDYTMTVEHFAVMEWRPSFDCRQPNNMDVANPRNEPLCFNNCPTTPAILPPATGCGIPIVHDCCSSSDCELSFSGCHPVIYRRESVTVGSWSNSDDCPIVYRHLDMPDCGCSSSSSSSSSQCRRKPQRHHRRHRRSSSSSCSSSSSDPTWPCNRVQWGHKHEESSHLPTRLQYGRPPCRRGPYWSPKMKDLKNIYNKA